MPQNLIEKIAQKFTIDSEHEVQSGDFISIRPAYVMTHDNTGAVIPKFFGMGAAKILNPRQVVHTLDHNIQDKTEKNLEKYRNIEKFSQKMGVDFYPAGRGIGHQIMCEEGYAWPGSFVVASDSHSNMYGGLGCLGTPIVRTDAAAIWATGSTWWQVPPVAKVEFIGRLKLGVTGKDVILTLIGFFNQDEVLNHAIEFVGEGVAHLNIEQRLTIANMTTEWGALAGIFPIDEMTIHWLKKRTDYIKKRGLSGVRSDQDGKGEHPRLNDQNIEALKLNKPMADQDSYYAKEITFDLSHVIPHVAGPNSVKIIHPISEISKRNIKINKAYLVSCVNSRVEDIAQAATILRGKKIADDVEFYIAAASSEVQSECENSGDWQVLLDAGAKVLPPGCGPCIGLGAGLLKDGEVGISATNRNFKGRMGSRDADAYLASPGIVAASALAGKITYPEIKPYDQLQGSIKTNPKTSRQVPDVRLISEFPEKLQGELVFCNQDNLNTDGIYPGKYTYIDDFTPEQQAQVVMENYDPEFGKIVHSGDFLVAGFNFGTGSSREQAATALKYRGLKLVIAGSFSETYKRNAINNGFLVLEVPELVEDLKAKFGSNKLTVRTDISATLEFKKSLLMTNVKSYNISPVGLIAQELIVLGGLENWVKHKLNNQGG